MDIEHPKGDRGGVAVRLLEIARESQAIGGSMLGEDELYDDAGLPR